MIAVKMSMRILSYGNWNFKEPKSLEEASKDECWTMAMHHELYQLTRNNVCQLVPPPSSHTIIESKWVFENTLDENGIVSLNYARTPKGSGIEVCVYADSDHARNYVNRKSTSGVCTLVGRCLTQWWCKKQTALAISTTEAEYVAAGRACQQALWMKQAIKDYDTYCEDVLVLCDNKGATDLRKNPVHHSRTKHIEIRHHSLRDSVQKGNILMEKVASKDNITDIFTKPLKLKTFNYIRLGIGMLKHEE
ncbi:hypothetical protein Tco_0189873 [Tanacetum coccineum]